MARPPAKDLTERELEIMQIFWSDENERTVTEARETLAANGRELAYTTVATLVRILLEKGYLQQLGEDRPYTYRAAKSFEDVSKSMVHDLLDRLFSGSRETMLMRLFDRKKLSKKEREVLQAILKQGESKS